MKDKKKKEQALLLYGVNLQPLRLSLQPFLQTIESKHYIKDEMGIQDADAVHAIWKWMHPRYAPTHLALYKGGDSVSLCNGPKSWGPVN
eukprot:12401280-Karenia_brevis.AAC.1